jgi:DNA invertase Pin-like site-specific DNA recombinase
MSIFILKCNGCGIEKDFKHKSRFDKIKMQANDFLCVDCKKIKSIENRTRICFKCNQKIICRSSSEKKRAESLNSVCKNCRSNQIPQTLTQQQYEFLTGLMLGDGGLVWQKTALYPRLNMVRQLQDKDYLFWQYNIFKDFYGTPPKYFKSWHKKAKKYYEGYACRTKSGQIFADFYNKWYPGGKKIVVKDLILTPLILLIWFLDDGCIVKTNKNGLRIKLSTDGFVKQDTQFLAKLLFDYTGQEYKVYKNGNGFVICGSTLATISYINIIKNIMPHFMARKNTWQDRYEYIINNIECFGQNKKNSVETRKLLSILGKKRGSIQRKMNFSLAQEVRELFNNKIFSKKELSLKYGVSLSIISSIIKGKIWKKERATPKTKRVIYSKEETDDTFQQCASKIKILLTNGFTTNQLAKIIKISKSTIKNIINGNDKCYPTHMIKLLKRINNIDNSIIGDRQRIRLTKNQINDIKQMINDGYNQSDIMEKYSLSLQKFQRIALENRKEINFLKV